VVAEGLGKRYGDKWGIRDASFNVPRGGITILVGPNGAGKTTTIRLLTTVLRPTAGRAYVLGYDVESEYKSIRGRIAYLPQECTIFNDWTPYEAVKWYLSSRGYSLSDSSRNARIWLERLGLWEYRNTSGWRLSGGTKRKVLLAMILSTNSELVFLDEPTTGIDVETRYSIWSILRNYVRDGGTIILTTHDMREGEVLSDYIILVSDGRVVNHGYRESFIRGLPYKYRVIIDGSAGRIRGDASIDLGDRRIIYFRRYRDVVDSIGRDDAAGVRIERTGLEDAYLLNVRGVTHA